MRIITLGTVYNMKAALRKDAHPLRCDCRRKTCLRDKEKRLKVIMQYRPGIKQQTIHGFFEGQLYFPIALINWTLAILQCLVPSLSLSLSLTLPSCIALGLTDSALTAKSRSVALDPKRKNIERRKVYTASKKIPLRVSISV